MRERESVSVLSHGSLVGRFFFFFPRFEESIDLIEKERGRKRKNFFLEMKKKKKKERIAKEKEEEEERKKMPKKKNHRRRKKEKKKEESRKKTKRERESFREVMCGKVVGPCMGKGNKKNM